MSRSWRAPWGLLVGLLTSSAFGQEVAREDLQRSTTAASSLRARSGVEGALDGLPSPTDLEMRALERLGSVGTPRALTLLSEAVLSPQSRSAEHRLVAVRALAPHAGRDEARRALVQVLGQGVPPQAPASDLDALVRETAALALAAAQTAPALKGLAQALSGDGPGARAAEDALLAHPPRDLRPLLEGRGAPTVATVQALARLGDQRAFHAIRRAVMVGSPAVRAAAALALTQLGDLETVALARHWLRREQQAELLVAAARILAWCRLDDARAALTHLLADSELQDEALRIAMEAPQKGLSQPLAKLLEGAEPERASLVLSALGRAGGTQEVGILASRLRDPETKWSAAYALALAPGSPARTVLQRSLEHSDTRALAARAAVVRAVALRDEISGLRTLLAKLLESHSALERSIGAWGLTTLEPRRGLRFLDATDLPTVRGAARAMRSPSLAIGASRRLLTEQDQETRVALSMALAFPAAGDQIPTEMLLGWLERGGPETPLVALALAARDGPELRPRLRALLANGDPLLRSHTALGLGRSKEPSAVGLLTALYQFEPDPRVRVAVVTALSWRREGGRMRALRLAANLDGSSRVREVARAALRGLRASPAPSQGPATLWLWLRESFPDSRRLATVLVQDPTGLAAPIVPDSDGLVVLTGLSPGPVAVEPYVLDHRIDPSSQKQGRPP